MGGKCRTWVHPRGVGAAVVTDAEYPPRVANDLLTEAVRIVVEENQGKWENITTDTDLASPAIRELFDKYQNPAEADRLTGVANNLGNVREDVRQFMGDLLMRGEHLDALKQKSEALSTTSAQFYDTARRQNTCCIIRLCESLSRRCGVCFS